MSLNRDQITLIQVSFKMVEPIAEQAAEIFYDKLFEFDPALKKLFSNDMKAQGKKLMTTLRVAVNSLNDLDGLVPVLQKLAITHVDYGVEAKDYTPVGNALLYTLKTGLGDKFTPEVRQAWVEGYRLIAQTMKSAAYPDNQQQTG